jgi:hypothetical protein
VASHELPTGRSLCGFAEALAAMHELVGSEVSVWVMGGRPSAGGLTLAFTGRVERGLELGAANDDPVAFEVGGVLLCLSERALASAWRGEYVGACGERRLVVGLRLVGSLEIELEQRRAASCADGGG